MRLRKGFRKIQLPHLFAPLEKTYRYIGFHGGRGSAKSHSVAAHFVLEGAKRKKLYLCTREIQRTLKDSVHRLLVNKIHAFGLQNQYIITQNTIRGVNGTEFIFEGLAANPEGIKSMEGFDDVWIEEAEKVSQRSLEMLTPTLRQETSRLIFTWNRRYKEDPVDDMFLGGEPPPDSFVQRVCWRDNPWFPKVLYKELQWQKRRDYDKYLHIWEGYPLMNSEARIFRNWNVADMDHELPKDAVPYLGADWGFAVDPTVIVECYIWDRKLYIRRERWALRLDIDDTPALFAGDDHRFPPRWLNRFGETGLDTVRAGYKIIGDSSRPETINHLKTKFGFNIIGSGNSKIQDGIEFINNHEIYIHPSCSHVIDEFGTYSYKVDKQTDKVVRPAVPEDKKNHTVDSVRYAIEEVRKHQAKLAGQTDDYDFLKQRSFPV